MYVGLNLTFASSFQMFRGAVIIFVAFLSMAFLNRRLGAREWSGIVFVFLGLCVVGVADFITNNDSSKYTRANIITGDVLIAAAQILTAIQMVYEEKYVARLDIPALQGKAKVWTRRSGCDPGYDSVGPGLIRKGPGSIPIDLI